MLEQKRSWKPFIILLAVIVVAFVGIFIIGNPFPSSPEYPQGPSSGCVVISDSGDYDNSIDIVFLGDNYDSLEEFAKDTEDFAESLVRVSPYDEYADRFNFFRIEDFKPIGCTYNDDVILCIPSNVKLVGSICPHDYFIVLSDINGVKNLFNFLRSSAWMGTASLNTADNKLVFAHEFAHLFADFADEYTWEEGRITWEAPNCDPDWETCPMFQIVEGSECWKGCVNDGYSRSVKVGIMKDYWTSSTYGVFNEHVLKNVLEENTAPSLSEVKNSPSNIYYVSGTCAYDGEYNCYIKNVEEGEGYSDNYVKNSPLYIQNGDNLVSIDSGKIFIDYGSEGTVEILSEFEFMSIVEKDIEDDIVKIVDSTGGVMSSYMFSEGLGNRVLGPSKKALAS